MAMIRVEGIGLTRRFSCSLARPVTGKRLWLMSWLNKPGTVLWRSTHQMIDLRLSFLRESKTPLTPVRVSDPKEDRLVSSSTRLMGLTEGLRLCVKPPRWSVAHPKGFVRSLLKLIQDVPASKKSES